MDFINRCPLHISIHALREEGDRLLHDVLAIPRSISIHALREEGDGLPCRVHRCGSISIHALREEGDRLLGDGKATFEDFYPRPPRGGRPQPISIPVEIGLFLSTPSARRATGC